MSDDMFKLPSRGNTKNPCWTLVLAAISSEHSEGGEPQLLSLSTFVHAPNIEEAEDMCVEFLAVHTGVEPSAIVVLAKFEGEHHQVESLPAAPPDTPDKVGTGARLSEEGSDE